MIELTRRLEARDLINTLSGIAVPVQQIIASGKLQPAELYRIEIVMQGLLALRQVLDVKDNEDRTQVERVKADILALATDVIEKARCLMRCGWEYRQQNDVESFIDSYCDALDLTLQILGLADSSLEPHFRVALRWTTS